jgi:hypothetical protein
MSGKVNQLLMQKLKNEKPLYSQLGANLWVVRGTLPFPQGLDYVYRIFAGKPPSDVFNHAFLLEPDSWPEQPSPQLHLTEELQSIMKLVRGTGSSDRLSGLDNTMTIVRAPLGSNPEKFRYLLYNPTDTDPKTTEYLDKLLQGQEVTDIVIPSRQTWQSLLPYTVKYPNAAIWHSGNVPRENLAEVKNELRPIPQHPGARSFEPSPDPIFPDVNLFRIEGDDITNEHVLFHSTTGVLSCTDLYHGAYTDYDPVNTWMCRFWFKCQRNGDYKSKTTLPQFRRQQIEQQGDKDLIQKAVNILTQVLPIEHLVFSHGTPPFSGIEAIDCLRKQYGLTPL